MSIREYYHQHLKRYIWPIIITFVVFTILGWFMTAHVQQDLLDHVLKMFDDKAIIDDMGNINAFRLFFNNLQASLVGVVMGIMPFVHLSIVTPVLNGFVVGIIFGGVAHLPVAKLPIWQLIVFGILPHGIFELAALFLSAAMGLRLSNLLGLKLKKKEEVDLGAFIQYGLKFFVTIIIPLIIVAALVETYVTPMLLGMLVG